jgi:hypothetical protein
MPRAWARVGATGDAGGAAGGKERSTEAQSNNCEGPRWGKKKRTTQSVTTEVRNFTFSLQRFLLDPPL